MAGTERTQVDGTERFGPRRPRAHRLRKEEYHKGLIGYSERLKALWEDPVWRANLLAKRQAVEDARKAAGIKRGGRVNVPTGVTNDQAKTFRRQAKFEASLTMKKLEAAGVLDDADEQAKEALKFGLTVMRDQTSNKKDALSAARMVLDFTKAKPAQKINHTVSTTEEWLAAVIEDNGQINKGSDSSP